MLPLNIGANHSGIGGISSTTASARNSMIMNNNSATGNMIATGTISQSGTQFRANSELKNHLLNLNNSKI
jgi:hypothetical protein